MMKTLTRLAIAFLGITLLLWSANAQEKFPTGMFAGGAFTLTFATDGVHTVSTEGKVVVKGTYSVEKDQITLTDKEGDFGRRTGRKVQVDL